MPILIPAMDLTETAPGPAIESPAGWEGRIARGFRLARVSWEVLAGDRRLLALPLMAALCALAAVVATVTLARRLHAAPEAVHVIAPVWVAAYLVSFVTIFFNVALTQVFTLAVFQHATGGPCFAGFPAGDLERLRDGRPLHALRRLRGRLAS